ncbi:MAG: hypothetical protein JST00_20295 [Deltaproteobacteria bacterium]|nr:hypothetical protein [Deltaproteobacteria bacterium]
MKTLSEEELRALLDDRGILAPGALAPPPRARCLAVFAQRPDPRLDVEALKQQASRFFATKLGLTVDKRYGTDPPIADAARIVVSGADPGASGTRLCYGRAASADDVAAAEEAERQQGSTGLALLAQRCRTVWLVVPEPGDDGADRVALTIAAIFASTMLGPILVPGGREIFGVRTARMKLEAH